MSGRSGGEVGRQTFDAGALTSFVAAASGQDDSPGTSETYTGPTVPAGDANRVLIVGVYFRANSSIRNVYWIETGGAEVQMDQIYSNAFSPLFSLASPNPGNQIRVEMESGVVELSFVAALYQNVDPNLSARLAVWMPTPPFVHNVSNADDIVVMVYRAQATIAGLSFAEGTERVRQPLANLRQVLSDQVNLIGGEVTFTPSAALTLDEAVLTALTPIFPDNSAAAGEATLAVAAPKFGQFHALAWVKGESDSAYSLYLSTEYGGVERGPAGTFQHARIEQADAGDWHIRDIGALSVPHGGLPEGANLGPLTLKLNGVATTPGLSADVDLDWDRVLLLPVEGGSAYVEKPSATDHVVLDTLSDAPGAYLWASASVFKGQPKYRGGAIYVHPRGTRIYLASDRSGDARPADGWTVTAKVVPRYLMI